jgi:hypothetical protein
LGIIAGLGRGIPGRPGAALGRAGAPPSRPAGGRGGRSPGPASPGRAAGRRPMPWVDENGLLPGRGAPGRAPPPPGRGPGVPGRRVSVSGATGATPAAAGAAGTSGSGAGAGFCGPGLGPGRGAVRAAGTSAAGTSGAGASGWGSTTAGASGTTVSACAACGAAAAGLAAAFLAGALGLADLLAAPDSPTDFSSAPYWSVNRFTTGGSTVDDADLTNSPISLSLARTTLLSTPSSLASSWTRTLATLLLLVRLHRRGWCGPLAGVHAHREVLIECS